MKRDDWEMLRRDRERATEALKRTAERRAMHDGRTLWGAGGAIASELALLLDSFEDAAARAAASEYLRTHPAPECTCAVRGEHHERGCALFVSAESSAERAAAAACVDCGERASETCQTCERPVCAEHVEHGADHRGA